MPGTTLTLCDGEVAVDYEVKEGEAMFLEAYIEGGALDCENLFISDPKKKSIVRLDVYFQDQLNDKAAKQPELLVHA